MPTRRAAGEQLAEQQAKSEDVGCGRHGAAEDLLRSGVFGGHDPGSRAVAAAEAVGAAGFENLGDAEVEELHFELRADQDVGRLEIAMHHQVAVGEAHGFANLEKERQAALDRRRRGVAEGGDRFAGDVLHDEVGVARRGAPAVEQPGDVRMLQTGEDLALLFKATPHLAAVTAAADDLDRRLLAELAVGALGEVDGAHPSAPQLAHDSERSDALAGGVGELLGLFLCDPREGLGGKAREGDVEHRARTSVLAQQSLDLLPEFGPAGTSAFEEAGTFVRRRVQKVVEQGRDLAPALGVEGAQAGLRGVSPSSRRRKARALRHSRSTVRTESRSTPAISSLERPPKKRISVSCADRGSISASRSSA